MVLVGEHRLDGEGNRRCGMARYGMSDELGASYGWCWDTAVLCTRMFELGPLLLSASFIFNDQRLWMATFYVSTFYGERIMVMVDGDGELCLGGSSG